MSMPAYQLPILPADGPRRLRVTDITQFVRLDQCERYLRFRLAENAGQDFMRDYGVAPQPIPPLLALSGGTFEDTVEEKLAAGFRAVHFAAKAKFSHRRPPNNADLAAEAQSLKPGDKLVCFQTRLVVPVEGWELRGDVDLVRLERLADG